MLNGNQAAPEFTPGEIKRYEDGTKLEAVQIELRLNHGHDFAYCVVVEFVELHRFIEFRGYIYEFGYVMGGKINYFNISPIGIEIVEDLGRDG